MKQFVGQWIGKVRGEYNSGTLVVNLELEPEGLVGSATYLDDIPELGAMFAERVHLLQTSGSRDAVAGTANVLPIQRNGTFFNDAEQLRNAYPDTLFPETVTISGKVVENRLELSFRTSLGQEMDGHLASQAQPRESVFLGAPDVHSWPTFKQKVSGLEPHRYIFRGQS